MCVVHACNISHHNVSTLPPQAELSLLYASSFLECTQQMIFIETLAMLYSSSGGVYYGETTKLKSTTPPTPLIKTYMSQFSTKFVILRHFHSITDNFCVVPDERRT